MNSRSTTTRQLKNDLNLKYYNADKCLEDYSTRDSTQLNRTCVTVAKAFVAFFRVAIRYKFLYCNF